MEHTKVIGVLLCMLIAWPILGANYLAPTLTIIFALHHVWIEKIIKQVRIAPLIASPIALATPIAGSTSTCA